MQARRPVDSERILKINESETVPRIRASEAAPCRVCYATERRM